MLPYTLHFFQVLSPVSRPLVLGLSATCPLSAGLPRESWRRGRGVVPEESPLMSRALVASES